MLGTIKKLKETGEKYKVCELNMQENIEMITLHKVEGSGRMRLERAEFERDFE